MATKKCDSCGAEFDPRSNRQKFCSEECKRGTATCRTCGVVFHPDRHSKGEFCSRKCWGVSITKPEPEKIVREKVQIFKTCPACNSEFVTRWDRQICCSRSCARSIGQNAGDNPRWKGGRTTHKAGYIKAMAKGHPAADDNGYVMEHRLVMEAKLGRLLEPWERVHHRNGERDDNRPENLELWIVRGRSKKDPAGQRAADLLDMVVSRSERYGLHPPAVRQMLKELIFTGA